MFYFSQCILLFNDFKLIFSVWMLGGKMEEHKNPCGVCAYKRVRCMCKDSEWYMKIVKNDFTCDKWEHWAIRKRKEESFILGTKDSEV